MPISILKIKIFINQTTFKCKRISYINKDTPLNTTKDMIKMKMVKTLFPTIKDKEKGIILHRIVKKLLKNHINPIIPRILKTTIKINKGDSNNMGEDLEEKEGS